MHDLFQPYGLHYMVGRHGWAGMDGQAWMREPIHSIAAYGPPWSWVGRIRAYVCVPSESRASRWGAL
jgi:hypothetical protein